MLNEIKYIFPILCVGLGLSLFWFGIHYYLKRKELSSNEISDKEKEWMNISKIAAYFFIILPFPLLLYLYLVPDFGFISFIILLGIPGALISILKKGKL